MADIRHTLLIAAPAQQIYQALTTAQGLSEWWTPGTEAIAQTGSIARFPFEPGYVKHMEIMELLDGQFVHWHCVKGDHEWIGTSLTFLLEANGTEELEGSHPEISGQSKQSSAKTATLLRFEHRNWRAYTASFAECSYTWAIFLRSLKSYCETGKGTPWPTQHQLD